VQEVESEWDFFIFLKLRTALKKSLDHWINCFY
jgi:hypothetical protein